MSWVPRHYPPKYFHRSSPENLLFCCSEGLGVALDAITRLAFEVISPNNRAADIAKKTQQYLDAGCKTVWIIYPSLRRAEIHSTTGVRMVREPQHLEDELLLPGFSLSLTYILDGHQQQQ